MASSRYSHNYIHGLLDSQNNWISNPQLIGQVLHSHFVQLFKDERWCTLALNNLPLRSLSDNHVQDLLAPLTLQELHTVVWSLSP